MDEAPQPEPVIEAPALSAAAGILYLAESGRVLLLKRGAGSRSYPGTWAVPAGHLEAGEAPMQAAIRESQEETGHAPAAGLELLRELDGFTLYLCRDPEFGPLLCSESDGYVWARPDDLPQPLHPGTEEAIAAALEHVARETAAALAPAMDDSARLFDTNGWFEVKGNPISKVGVFVYAGSQLPGAPDPGQMYRVYRPAEELSDPECIASFRLLPWINDHKMLGDEELDLTPAEKKGVHGVIGEDVYFEAPYLRGNLKVFSQSLANLIEAGKRELSPGYRCTYEWTPGVFDGQAYDCVQRTIRGNHLALVMSGRTGPDVAVLDEAPTDQEPPTSAKEPSMADETKGEGGSSMTLEDAVAAIKSLAPAITALLALAGGAPAEKPAATDEETPKDTPDDDPEKKKGMPAMDAKDKPAAAAQAVDAQKLVREAMAAAKRRDALAGKVSEHVGTFDAADMTEDEVAAYGCEKLGLKVAKGQEVAAITGYLAAAVAPRKQALAGAGMDAGAGDNFVTRHLNKSKE